MVCNNSRALCSEIDSGAPSLEHVQTMFHNSLTVPHNQNTAFCL